jgi:hypothetical protein
MGNKLVMCNETGNSKLRCDNFKLKEIEYGEGIRKNVITNENIKYSRKGIKK